MVPDEHSAALIEQRNGEFGQQTPIDVPLDAVAELEPAPLAGQADLTAMLDRNVDDGRGFLEAMPSVWAHAMIGDPDDPAPHLRDFAGHARGAVRIAAFALAHGWQARDVMDALRDAEPDPRIVEMMSSPEWLG